MTFAFIEQHATTWPVRLTCRVLGGPRLARRWVRSSRLLPERGLVDSLQG